MFIELMTIFMTCKDCGMWDMVSSAKSSNPPLSKEVFLQERGLADDHWENDEYGDHEDWGEDGESDEDN